LSITEDGGAQIHGEDYAFIQYLKDKFGEKKLSELGTSSLDDFCLSKYLEKV